MAKKKYVTVPDYAEKYNPILTKRGHKMSPSYIWRIIREDIAGKPRRRIPWFKYKLFGDKENIFIQIEDED